MEEFEANLAQTVNKNNVSLFGKNNYTEILDIRYNIYIKE